MNTTTDRVVLLGPADADHYRVKVGRYGDRWYTDPLPTCPIANASDWQGPSISSVKKANSNDWSYVAMTRCSRDLVAHRDRYTGDQAAIYEQLKIANKLGLDVDAGRGTIIHAWLEDLLHGRPMREWTEWDLAAHHLSAESLTIATAYKPAIQAWFDIHQPELVATEFVCIDRHLNDTGYGGTGDAIVRIDDAVWLVDWKSRGPTSEHGAYPEEAAQVSALAGAEYMIVQGANGNPTRQHLPALHGGLIVSIKPDGCRAYPIDLVAGKTHWAALHAWWCARRNEREPIGRSWAAKAAKSAPAGSDDRKESGAASSPSDPAGEPTDLTWRIAAKARYDTWSETERLEYTEAKKDIDTSNPDQVFALMDHIDRFNIRVEAPAPVVTEPVTIDVPQPPDEGADVDTADVLALSLRYTKLNDRAQAWTSRLVTEGNNGWTFRIREKPTVRRYEIYRAILTLAETYFKEGA